MKYRVFFQCSCCKRGWTDIKETVTEAVEIAQRDGCPYGCLPGGTIYLTDQEKILNKA